MSAWKHVRAILLLPFLVTIVIPAVLIILGHHVLDGSSLASPWCWVSLVVGGVLSGAGLVMLVETIRMFATVGEGTLAPWDPTQKMVVHGVYRHVRNPMIASVFSILLGEAVLLRSWLHLAWFLVFVVVNLAYIPRIEEPDLVRRFGQECREYCEHVPRWIPRVRPWDRVDGR
jgi:protein-S-isoprenylcysteine O-methyltransferase Ste14